MSPRVLDEIQLSRHVRSSGIYIQRGFETAELNYRIFLVFHKLIFISDDVGFFKCFFCFYLTVLNETEGSLYCG
jgi:hypothetical protein